MTNTNHHQLDTQKLLCPLPVIRLQQLINRLPTGETVEVLCTDPGTLHDIPAWCRIHGHTCLSIEQTANQLRFIVKICR